MYIAGAIKLQLYPQHVKLESVGVCVKVAIEHRCSNYVCTSKGDNQSRKSGDGGFNQVMSADADWQ